MRLSREYPLMETTPSDTASMTIDSSSRAAPRQSNAYSSIPIELSLTEDYRPQPAVY